jgi:dihydropteroate synthase
MVALRNDKMTLSLRLRNDQLINFPRPAIMGIINMSPNSFFRPHLNITAALATAENMIAAGADILDIGGEATNPFVDIQADLPSEQAEIDRVIPLILAIKQRFNILISVDTSRPAVMHAAVQAGADLINDQRALQSVEALQTVASLNVPVCLMHFFTQRQPGSCDLPSLLAMIKHALNDSIKRCENAGISADRIIIDPGFGQGHYGKNSEENYYLLTHLAEFVAMGYPVLSGWSRKSMIGDALGLPVEERLFGSIAADTLAVYHGAAIIRTHDVRASREAVTIAINAMA